MNFNLGNLVKIANSISNPQQGLNLLLNQFAKSNPKMANEIRQAINSGKNPKAFIMEQARSGKITLDNLNDLKKYYNMAQRFGLTKKVPQNVWNEAENAIKSGSGTNTQATKTPPTMPFKGF